MQQVKVFTKSAGELTWSSSHGYHWDFAHNGDLVIFQGKRMVSLVLAQDILAFEEEY